MSETCPAPDLSGDQNALMVRRRSFMEPPPFIFGKTFSSHTETKSSFYDQLMQLHLLKI